MRVFQVHNRYLEAGGEDGVVRREGSLLQDRGHEVLQLEFENPESKRRQSADLLVSNWNLRSARRARSELERFGPDVVHIHNLWYQASPSVAAAASDIAPVVATLHNYRRICLNALLYREGQVCTDCVGTLPWRGVVRRCYRGSAPASAAIGAFTTINRVSRTLDRSVDRFLVLSDFAADLTEQSGVDSSSIARHDNFVPDPGPRAKLASGSDVVLAVGRLSPEKGFEELIAAWNDTAPDGLSLLIVGDGPEMGHLQRIAGPSVQLAGRRTGDQVRELMLSSRALLLPSRWYEGQPLVLLEALAAGLPILVSDQPPLREVVEGTDQLVVEPDDWRDALTQLADNEWLVRASRSARERFEQRFTAEVAGNRLESIYREVLR